MSDIKIRAILTSELNGPVILRDDFGGDSLSFGTNEIFSKIVKPRIDLIMEWQGIEYKHKWSPYGEPVPGRLLGILLISLALMFFVIYVQRKG